MGLLDRIQRLEAEAELQRRALARAARPLAFGEWLGVVSPAMAWDAPHLVHIREQLERLAAGEIRRLAVFTPPRHGKSNLIAIHFPAWFVERNPDRHVILAGHSALLAEKFSRRARRICASRVVLSDERNTAGEWETSEGGGLRAVGVGGAITGMGGDLVVIDDPVRSREEAHSQAFRERAWEWFTSDLLTRLEPDARLVLVQTRWHQDDLAGRILAGDDAAEWAVVNLPALAEADDPLGRAEGEALWPDRYDERALAAIRQSMGEASFAALYQQRPSALEGAIFKREWWRSYRETPAFDRVVLSLDTAFKAGADNDYSCATIWGEGRGGYYLLDLWKRRVEFPELKLIVAGLGERWKPSVVLVEDKASGQSLIQELKRDTRLPVLPVKVDSDKVSRAYAVTPLVETGRVFLPESAPWLADYVDSMASFPNAAHDDDVDSTTQALNYMIGRDPTTGMLEFMRAEAERAARPVSPDVVRLRLPQGMGGVALANGQMMHGDAERCVVVPAGMERQLLNAGLERMT